MSAQNPFDESDPSRFAEESLATDPSVGSDDTGVLYEEDVVPQPGVLGMTLRELLIVAFWLVAFVASFFPVLIGGRNTLWTQGLEWILPIGVPTAAVFLIVLRRFSPDGIRRVGSLGIDQFASVAFSVAAVYWVQFTWDLVSAMISTSGMVAAWVPWVSLVATVGLVVLTVAAPLIPRLREDFLGRLETLAHRNADPARPVAPRVRRTPEDENRVDAADPAFSAPPPPAQATPTAVEAPESDAAASAEPVIQESEPVVPEPAPVGYSEPPFAESTQTDTDVLRFLSLDDTHDTGSPAPGDVETTVTSVIEPVPAPQPFWALAPTERDVVDETGTPLFRIGPTAWALVIEDRGGAYVIRHDDGRIGYLHEISDMTKG